ncbi:signal transduction histidine kinase [Streptosporangium becharense]|uniref:histidine kinase n=1 Tax=Streptosporangium becharense TaxID=1816182 RepID=A0A7W9IKZ5_9ACTN|nr:sensor histidine kinase [Streptosporangium becharense]MBB2911503.1 signal transduction histidine kinase [Streptosporangium becharense]MBB5822679.1 signal transduction histidine kinase [Streptosporangium becharense]
MRVRVAAATRWAGGIDPRIVDIVFALVTTGLMLTWAAADHSGPWRRPDAAAVALTCLANLPIALRTRAPFTVLAVCCAASACHHALGYQADLNNAVTLLALYTVAARCTTRVSLAGAVITVLTWWWASFLAASGLELLNGLQSAVFVAAAWAFGTGTRRLAERNEQLAELSERLRLEQEERARQAVSAERVRIARELHDIVAHHMSVISVHAGLARYVFGSDPGTARAALATVADTSHEVLEDMRRLLVLLRVDHDGADTGGNDVYDPTPGLAQLGRLVERVRLAGVPVEVDVTGDVRGLNAGIELCAYRVVQESLTNVIKHTVAAGARVRLHYGADELVVVVTDDGSPSPAAEGGGHGLLGMRERVRLYGGAVSAGPLPQGGFEVVARLPLSSPGGE